MTAHRLLPVAAWILASTASALSQDAHYQITLDACLAQGFPVSTCRELAVANHNTDAHEWEDMSAHSQLPPNGEVCEGINATFARVRSLTSGARVRLAEQEDRSRTPEQTIVSAREALFQLGRALHTVQDNCAHAGMPNPQHAWFSVSDMCLNTASSPDIRADAFECAEQATVQVFDAFRRTMDELGVAPDELYQGDAIARTQKLWPIRSGLCDYVRSPKFWDGIDRGWDNAYVTPQLLIEVEEGLVGASSTPRDSCAEPAGVIDLKDPQPPQDTNQNLTCQAVEAVCSGNPNGRDEIPPWESDLAQVISSACTSAPAAMPSLMAVALALLALRRRR